MIFVSNIKKLREENQWTQEEICRRLAKFGCRIDRSTYTKYENGTRSPSVATLIKLSACFNVSTDYILCLTDKKKSL